MKKKYIIFIILLIIYIIIMFLIFGKDKLGKKETSYLMISNDIKWKLENGKWSDVSNNDNILTSMANFHVYADNKYLGDYNLTFNEKWYVFDNNRNSINYDGELLAFTDNLKMDVIEFKKEQFNNSDNEVIKKVLESNNINTNNIKNKEKISMDFDNDGQIETLYMINNLFENADKSYGLVFITDNNKIKILHKEITNNINMYDLCMPYISNIVDINQDKKYEIIIGCGYFSNRGNCASMFELQKGKYEKIKSCK